MEQQTPSFERLGRILAAILHADVAGYSRLMAKDAIGTVQDLDNSREISRKHISAFGGSIVDMAGDSVLAIFETATGATSAALAIQAELGDRNRQKPEERRMRFRIGVNLGEVMVRADGGVFGDGVNIAARLQQLAEPGGVCVSGAVFDQIDGKLAARFESMGEQSVKNIPRPVRAYRLKGASQSARGWNYGTAAVLAAASTAVLLGVLWSGSGPSSPDRAAKEGLASPANDLPSLAVLPFKNIGTGTEYEWFTDGMSETLLTDLARLPHLLVISSESSFAYKGKSVDIRQIGKDLNVRYVLEGSVQRTKDRLRMTVQLTDTTSGRQMWTERYDRPLDDVFAVQDEVVDRIVTELDVALLSGQQARDWRRTTRNREAHDLYLRAMQHYYRYTQQDMAEAEALAAQALKLDPNCAVCVSTMGWIYYQQGDAGWQRPSSASYQQALDMARKAVALDPQLGIAHALESSVLLNREQYTEAMAATERALAASPNQGNVVANSAWNFATMGRANEAVQLMQRALRLNPFPPAWYYGGLGESLTWSGRPGEGAAALQKVRGSIAGLSQLPPEPGVRTAAGGPTR
jgi:adenylate cyclase